MNDINIRKYVIQPNAISRSIYSASTYARRLMAMAMSVLGPIDPENAKEEEYTAEFSNYEFMKSLGIKEGSKEREIIYKAVGECMGNYIKIPLENEYKFFTWFTSATVPYQTNRTIHDKIRMTFNPELALVIGDFKKAYAYINLIDFGKLQGKYAIRIYEFVMSWDGLKNKKNEWTTPLATIADIRLMFDVGKKYKKTAEFKRNIIDYPVDEINEADIGIYIKPVYEKKGKMLFGVRFLCRWVSRDEPKPTQSATETGKTIEKLRDDHLEEWSEMREEAKREQPPLKGLNINEDLFYDGVADEKLQNKYSKKKTSTSV